MFFSIKDTIHVMLKKHELCSLPFFMVCGLALVFVSGLLGLGVCHTLTTRVLSVGFNTWLGCSWLKQSAHLICIDVLVWDMSMNIILHHFWKKRQSEDCVVLGGDGHGLGQKNESLQSMLLIGSLKDQNEFYDARNNYPRQSNLCSPTAVWLRTMSLTVPARRCNSANPCL